jgi:hypothetical protein
MIVTAVVNKVVYATKLVVSQASRAVGHHRVELEVKTRIWVARRAVARARAEAPAVRAAAAASPRAVDNPVATWEARARSAARSAAAPREEATWAVASKAAAAEATGECTHDDGNMNDVRRGLRTSSWPFGSTVEPINKPNPFRTHGQVKQ